MGPNDLRDLDPIVEEIKRIMYEKVKDPKFKHRSPEKIFYMAIQEMYRKKHSRR
jgi:hypothetical protein